LEGGNAAAAAEPAAAFRSDGPGYSKGTGIARHSDGRKDVSRRARNPVGWAESSRPTIIRVFDGGPRRLGPPYGGNPGHERNLSACCFWRLPSPSTAAADHQKLA